MPTDADLGKVRITQKGPNNEVNLLFFFSPHFLSLFFSLQQSLDLILIFEPCIHSYPYYSFSYISFVFPTGFTVFEWPKRCRGSEGL